jgi:hypothetical protein
MTEYFYPDYPRLYRINGEYAQGLAKLFGAHECLDGNVHDIVNSKCTKCSVHIKEKNNGTTP